MSTARTTDTWTLTYNFATNPIPMNGQHGSHWAKTAQKAAVRRRTKLAALEAKIPVLGRCTVQLTWYVRDATRRDADNLGTLEKAMFDGLTDALVVVDDIPQLMTKRRARIIQVDRTEHAAAWMELTITRTAEPLLIIGDSRDAAVSWAHKHGITGDQWKHFGSATELMGQTTADLARVILTPKSRALAIRSAHADLLAVLAASDAKGTR